MMKCMRCGKKITASACECGFIADDFSAISLFPMTENEKVQVKQVYRKSEFLIENGIFDGYCGEEQIRELRIPDGVTKIRAIDGENLQYLSRLVIPASVEKINRQELQNLCLEEIIVNDANTIFYSKEGVLFRYGASYPVEGFKNSDTIIHDDINDTLLVYPCNRKTSFYRVPGNIARIASEAFSDAQLEHIVLPSSLKSIGDRAFCNCDNLTEIDIPDGVRILGDDCVFDCPKLRSLSMPFINHERTPFPHIKVNEFTLRISDLRTEIDENEFSLSAKEEKNFRIPGEKATVILPNTVTSIQNYAFFGCRNLVSINLPKKLLSIGAGAFMMCVALSQISFPNEIQSIKECAFFGCVSLKAVTLSSNVNVVKEKAFEGCFELKRVEIQSEDTQIAEGAFNSCLSLKIDNINAPTDILEKILSTSKISEISKDVQALFDELDNYVKSIKNK